MEHLEPESEVLPFVFQFDSPDAHPFLHYLKQRQVRNSVGSLLPDGLTLILDDDILVLERGCCCDDAI